jgi:hypothetical protein
MAGFKIFRLSDRCDGSARGLACDRDGLFFGGYALVTAAKKLVTAAKNTRGHDAYEPRGLDEINWALSAAYGVEVDFTSRMPGLTLAARYLSEGKWALAQIAALQLRIPDLPDDAAVERLRKIEAFQRGNPNHFGPGPRADNSRQNPTAATCNPPPRKLREARFRPATRNFSISTTTR